MTIDASTLTIETVRERLKSVIDPELGVNIIDLGLVYHVEVDPGLVAIRMTMTTPACPLGPYLTDAIETTLFLVAAGRDVVVDVVWDPPWQPDMMTEAARRQLGWRP